MTIVTHALVFFDSTIYKHGMAESSRAEEIVVLITTASKEEAERIATSLVEQGLAACATLIPQVTSIFSWQGKVCREEETLMIVKSRSALFSELTAVVQKMHSYETPEIIALPIADGSEDYLKWLRHSTR